MFKLINDGNAGGDCSRYQVELDKAYTVREFIEALQKNKAPGEWGDVHIFVGPVAIKAVKYTYAAGKYQPQAVRPVERLGPDVLARKVTRATATGGWGSMTYYIHTT